MENVTKIGRQGGPTSYKKCTLRHLAAMAASKKFDVVIIGGGPAGMTAALWCDELKLSSCIIEKRGSMGGQLSWIHNSIENYPGARFSDGSTCLEEFKASISERSFELLLNTSAVALDTDSRSVLTTVGPVAADSIVIASGVRRRRLEVPGEEEFRGKGLLDSGSRDRHQTEGMDVAVVGGGDAALENALILSEFARRVFLIHRRDHFVARREFIDAVAANDKIEPVMNATVVRFGGDRELEFIEIKEITGTRQIRTSHAVVRIGVVPNSEFLHGIIDLDSRGYVRVDHLGRTSVAGVYAIGDIAFPASPTIATAVGSAATVVKTISAVRKHE